MSNHPSHLTTEVKNPLDLSLPQVRSPPLSFDQLSLSQHVSDSNSSSSDSASVKASSELTTSSEDSEESYREKFLHLQVLVRQLNKQLKSERIRRDGVDTLSHCLRDERKQNVQLKQENEHLELAIQTLQGRLANNGLSTSVQLEEGENMASGLVEQSAFDSIIKENLSLKSELKYLAVDPQKMEEALKQNTELSQKVLQLQQDLLHVQSERQNYQQMVSSSEDGNIQEINRLRAELDEMRQKALSKDILCESLSEQSQILQERLRETSALCQQLLQRLEKLEPSLSSSSQSQLGSLFERMRIQSGASLTSSAGVLNLEPSQSPSSVHREVLQMKAKLDEVTQVNQKWQEYHNKREREFSELQARLSATEQQLMQATAPGSPQLTEKQQENIDRLVLQYKRQIGGIEDELEKVTDENRLLRQEHKSLSDTNEDLEQKIRMLLERSRSSHGGGATSAEEKAKIQALELQIKICTEDFESERRDREKAQQRISDLEMEVNIYKSQFEASQRGAASHISGRRHHNRQPYTFECDMVNLDDVPMPEPAPLIARGPDIIDDEDLEPGEDVVDLPIKKTKPLVAVNGNTETDDDSLQCPQCTETYRHDKHMDLLTHMENCIK